jgi:hypothetical protein
MERDDELDAAEAALSYDPHIESPDELEIPIGGNCWVDQSRKCGADCVAFNRDLDRADPARQCLIIVNSSTEAGVANKTHALLESLFSLLKRKQQGPGTPMPPKVM